MLKAKVKVKVYEKGLSLGGFAPYSHPIRCNHVADEITESRQHSPRHINNLAYVGEDLRLKLIRIAVRCGITAANRRIDHPPHSLQHVLNGLTRLLLP